MEQLDLIGFLDTVGYSTTNTPVAQPDQLVIKFDKVGQNQQVVDATTNDISRLTNLFKIAWVYLNPNDILGYQSDGTTTTLLIKPAALAVQPGKNTDIYNLFAIKGTVAEKIVGQQAAVELTTPANNVILPSDPASVALITRTSQTNAPNIQTATTPTRIIVPVPGMTTAPVVSPTGMNGNQAVITPATVGPVSPATNLIQGQPGGQVTSTPPNWAAYWIPL